MTITYGDKTGDGPGATAPIGNRRAGLADTAVVDASGTITDVHAAADPSSSASRSRT